MNKLYKTLDLYAAWLIEVGSYNSLAGIKNIIGVKVTHNGECLFYSILDNCFFRILPQNDPTKNTCENRQERLFVEIYEYQKPPYELKTLGMDLYRKIKKDSITKKEIIEYKKLLTGYFSDLDCDSLQLETNVDFEDSHTIEENIIDTVQEYEEKLGRPITYDRGHIYGPSKVKTSNNKVV